MKRRYLWIVLAAFVLIAYFIYHQFIPADKGYPLPVTGTSLVYLPLVVRNDGSSTPGPLTPAVFHVPYLNYSDIIDERLPEMAIFWFGQVTPFDNYTDVRIGYNNTALYLHAAVIDRLLWYNTAPSASNLTQYDAITLYLDPTPNSGSTPSTAALRIEAQIAPEYVNRVRYQAVYRWSGSRWDSISTTSSVVTSSGWRSDTAGFNDLQDDRGWYMDIVVPFSNLGLSDKPADQSRWKLAVISHDRDDANGSQNSTKSYPPGFDPGKTSTWKDIAFGLLQYQAPGGSATGSATIREGINGASVPDASAGGNTTCGDGLRFWADWGNKVYNTGDQISEANVQNQRDIADWPCYSKYYLSFPLDQIPAGKTILSAEFTLYQFGNAGNWDAGQIPYRSLIQVFMVDGSINPNTLNWNNAPLPLENVAQAWVDPFSQGYVLTWPGVPRSFDLTYAVTLAQQQNIPLRLAVYSADGAYHSGKYFSTSDREDWAMTARPVLRVLWR